MPRPYRDPVELVVEPLSQPSAFVPADAKIVLGVVAPGASEAIPVVLLPGFEYRMRQ